MDRDRGDCAYYSWANSDAGAFEASAVDTFAFRLQHPSSAIPMPTTGVADGLNGAWSASASIVSAADVAFGSSPNGSRLIVGNGGSSGSASGHRRSILPPILPNPSPHRRSSSPRHHTVNQHIENPSPSPRRPFVSPWQRSPGNQSFPGYPSALPPSSWPNDTITTSTTTAAEPTANSSYSPNEALRITSSDHLYFGEDTTFSQPAPRPMLSHDTRFSQILNPDTPARPSQSRVPTDPTPAQLNTQAEPSLFFSDDTFTGLLDDSWSDPGFSPSPPDSTQTHSSSEAMLATRKRAAAAQEVPQSKKQRTTASVTAPTTTRRQHSPNVESIWDDDDLFGENPTQITEPNSDDLQTIDLTEANTVPEELLKPDEDKRIKIGAFQCVICMDDVTALTVTHCGHLYCAQCLNHSIHVDATKGKCPMCRSKIDMRPREQYTTKAKGYWPLELKLMTATRKGKRKAEATT